MNLSRSFQVVSRLLALVGLLSLIQTGEIGFFFLTIGLVSVLVSLGLVYWEKPYVPGKVLWTTLNVLVLSYFAFDLFLLSESLLVASTHFIIFLMINKLFNLRSPQDHQQLYVISLLQLLAASTFTINFSFLAVFVLYLLTATWALLLHHLVTENREYSGEVVPGVNRTGSPPGISWPFFFNTNLIAIVALCCTVLLFVSLPRISMGFFHQEMSNLIRMSGFSDAIDLGEIGPVKKDFTVVMRVKPSAPMPFREGIYWRGKAFDHYNGSAWSDSSGKGRNLSSQGTGRVYVGKSRNPSRQISQEIILEPVDAPVIFGAPDVVSVQGPISGVRVNDMGSLSFLSTPATRVAYSVISEIPVLTKKDSLVKSVSLPTDLAAKYLQLPDGADRIRDLAREVTASSGTLFSKARSIEIFLEQNYRYTLDVRPPLFENPVEDFLFSQKAGFCEHYATSMVLMLRTLGIPARIVTGFLPGEWNEIGGHFIVRQSDAHAWVEVWFPNTGWYPFDPTPSVPGDPAPELWTYLTSLIDSLHWKWNRYVISYNFRDQMELASGIKSEARSLRLWMAENGSFYLQSFREKLYALMTHRVTIFIFILGAGGMLILSSWRRKWGLKWPGFSLPGWLRRPTGNTAVRFYFVMLETLRKEGFQKPDFLTPREFVQGLSLSGRDSAGRGAKPWYEAAHEITRLYYRVRFAGIPLSNDEERRVEDLLGDLKKGLSLS